jgi:butyrate kinase
MKGGDLMDISTETLTREELAVVLDALANYIEYVDERKSCLIKRQARSTVQLDQLVLQALMDESVKDLKDMAIGFNSLIKKRLKCFEEFNKLAYIVDPVCIDEMHDLAKVSGLKGIERQSIFHALNQKATAKRYARDNNRKYEDLTLIVAHLGGGISVGLHHKGKVIDVNEALLGDGPFSPERTGTLPAGQLATLCFSGKYTLEEIKKMIAGKGGLVSYLGTSNGVEISNRIHNGDREAEFYFHAMAYQISKEIGALYFVAQGNVDAIIATGGLAYNSDLMGFLKEYINPIRTLTIYPGENEMQSLAEGVLRVLEGSEEALIY